MVKGVIKEVWFLLNKREKLRMILTVAINSSLSLLDIVAVSIVGAVGALAVNNIKGTNSGNRVNKLLNMTNLDKFSTSSQIIILASMAVLFLALKSFFSYKLTKKIFQFSNRCSNRLSISLLKEWTNKDITFLESRSTQENVFILSSGISNLISGVLGNFFALATDVLLSILLFSSLLLVDKLSALICLGTLSVTLIILFRRSSNLSFLLGKQQVMKSVVGNEMTAEFLNSWREIYARQSDIYYLNSIRNNREILTKNATNMKMIPMSSKYIIETLVIVILLGVTSLQFAINDAARASGNIALFMAASTRFAPALLRIQQYAIQLINSAGQAKRTLEVINEKQLKEQKEERLEESDLQTRIPESSVILKCEDVSFKYPGAHKNTLEDIDFEVMKNTLTAIIGPSGSGKSTLIDLMLGLLTPAAGKVRLAGDLPKRKISSKRIKVAYVPQAVQIHRGTLRDNILLGIPSSEIDDETILQALSKSGVLDLKELGGNDLNMMIGDRGMSISGGQRQRIGVARALVTKPQIIFLDEITSALDPKSENLVSNALLEMRIDTTIVVIAHRLSTIESADQIVYLDQGKILARGNYSELRKVLPHFDYQVKSIGLD